jgi:protein-L-isoaspartate(D-aspartate) O-methyltransferase
MGLAVTRIDAAEAPPAGPFEAAVCEGAVSQVPAPWWEALSPQGGRLGAVERSGPVGRAQLWLRTPRGVGRRDLFDCAPPMMAGFEPRAAFAF